MLRSPASSSAYVALLLFVSAVPRGALGARRSFATEHKSPYSLRPTRLQAATGDSDLWKVQCYWVSGDAAWSYPRTPIRDQPIFSLNRRHRGEELYLSLRRGAEAYSSRQLRLRLSHSMREVLRSRPMPSMCGPPAMCLAGLVSVSSFRLQSEPRASEKLFELHRTLLSQGVTAFWRELLVLPSTDNNVLRAVQAALFWAREADILKAAREVAGLEEPRPRKRHRTESAVHWQYGQEHPPLWASTAVRPIRHWPSRPQHPAPPHYHDWRPPPASVGHEAMWATPLAHGAVLGLVRTSQSPEGTIWAAPTPTARLRTAASSSAADRLKAAPPARGGASTGVVALASVKAAPMPVLGAMSPPELPKMTQFSDRAVARHRQWLMTVLAAAEASDGQSLGVVSAANLAAAAGGMATEAVPVVASRDGASASRVADDTARVDSAATTDLRSASALAANCDVGVARVTAADMGSAVAAGDVRAGVLLVGAGAGTEGKRDKNVADVGRVVVVKPPPGIDPAVGVVLIDDAPAVDVDAAGAKGDAVVLAAQAFDAETFTAPASPAADAGATGGVDATNDDGVGANTGALTPITEVAAALSRNCRIADGIAAAADDGRAEVGTERVVIMDSIPATANFVASVDNGVVVGAQDGGTVVAGDVVTTPSDDGSDAAVGAGDGVVAAAVVASAGVAVIGENAELLVGATRADSPRAEDQAVRGSGVAPVEVVKNADAANAVVAGIFGSNDVASDDSVADAGATGLEQPPLAKAAQPDCAGRLLESATIGVISCSDGGAAEAADADETNVTEGEGQAADADDEDNAWRAEFALFWDETGEASASSLLQSAKDSDKSAESPMYYIAWDPGRITLRAVFGPGRVVAAVLIPATDLPPPWS